MYFRSEIANKSYRLKHFPGTVLRVLSAGSEFSLYWALVKRKLPIEDLFLR